MISLSLYGLPVPQSRPKFFKRGDRVVVYDSKAKFKEGCRWQLRSQYQGAPLTVPVRIDMIFYMPIPKATSSIRRAQMLNGRLCHMKKPDVDNLQKFAFDCLNKIIIEDDSQVTEVRAKKVYSTNPSTEILVIPLSDLETV